MTKRKLLPAKRAYVKRVKYADSGLEELQSSEKSYRRFILEYPTVYIISLRDKQGPIEFT